MNRFDVLALPGGRGSLLLSAFPGEEDDLDRMARADAALLVSLTPAIEMTALGVPPDELTRRCTRHGIAWRHMAIADMAVAGSKARTAWREIGPLAHGLLDAGRAVAIHCRMGLGRTGTIAGILLVERGMAPDAAIAAIRSARPGSIETLHQERMIEDWAERR